MGWLHTQGSTKQDLVNELTQETEVYKTLHKSLRGNVLWSVIENKATKERLIACFLLRSGRGYGWGYKSIDESMGPLELSCPLKFFDIVPDPGGYATEWRKRVRLHNKKKSEYLSNYKRAEVGDTVVIYGKKYRVTHKSPYFMGESENGRFYRLVKSRVEEVIK